MLDLFIKVYYKILCLFIGNQNVNKIRKKNRMLKKAKIIQAHGQEAITTFSEVIKSSNSNYWLFWGTLLGACREKGFIKHDTDIDVGMFDTDISIEIVEKMIEKGFRILKVIVDKDIIGGQHIAFDYKGIKFDIYSFHKDRDNTVAFNPVPYNFAKFGEVRRKDIMDIVHVTMPSWSTLQIVPFENIYCPIPSNAPDILRILYGDSYMTPIAGKKPDDKENPNIVHENPCEHYACVMSFETYKMLNKYRLNK